MQRTDLHKHFSFSTNSFTHANITNTHPGCAEELKQYSRDLPLPLPLPLPTPAIIWSQVSPIATRHTCRRWTRTPHQGMSQANMAQDRLRRSTTPSVYCSIDKQTIKISKRSTKKSSSDSIENIITSIRTLRTASHLTSSFTAGSRVAHIPEILENILLRTIDTTSSSKKRLLMNQRVCKAFRNTISGWSVRLRRELCFPTPNLRWDHPSAGCNGLLIDRFPGLRLGDGTQIEVSVLCGTVRDRGLEKADLEVIVLRRPVREAEGSDSKADSWRRMKLRRDDHWVKVVVAKGMHQERKACERQNPTLGEIVKFVYPELSW